MAALTELPQSSESLAVSVSTLPALRGLWVVAAAAGIDASMQSDGDTLAAAANKSVGL